MGVTTSYYGRPFYRPTYITPNPFIGLSTYQPRIIYTNQYPTTTIVYTNQLNRNVMNPGYNQMNIPRQMPYNSNVNQSQYQINQKPLQKDKEQLIDNDVLSEIKLTSEILEKGEQKQCPICLEKFAVDDMISYFPCFHYFHAECIKKWMSNSNRCPVCNFEFKLK